MPALSYSHARGTPSVGPSIEVAAAVGTRPSDRDRVRALVAAEVDAIIIDSSQGDSVFQHEMVKWMKQELLGQPVLLV